MSDILREIDEDLAKDRSEQFVEKWGLPIGLFIAIFVVGLFFYFNWQARSQEAAFNEADSFAQAVDQLLSDPATAQAILTELSTSRSGFGDLAAFKQGDALLAQGDLAGAIAAWQAYRDAPGSNPYLAASTQLKLVWFGLNILQPAEIFAEIESLEQRSAYRPYAPILRALVFLRQGDKEAAFVELEKINFEPPLGPLEAQASALAESMRGLIGTL